MATRKDARESEQQQQDQSTKQQTAASGGTSQSASGAVSGSVSDRERPLRTSREGNRGQALSRSSQYGAQSGNYLSPFGLMRQISDSMDQLFQNFGMGTLGAPAGLWGREPTGSGLSRLEGGVWAPQVELFQRGDQLVVRADLPGLSPDDVHVDIEDDVLTIQGERRNEYESGGEEQGFYRSERSYGSFFRAIQLPEGVNADSARASFQDGVLEVTVPLPTSEQRRSRRIPVSAQSQSAQSRGSQSPSSQSPSSQSQRSQKQST